MSANSSRIMSVRKRRKSTTTTKATTTATTIGLLLLLGSSGTTTAFLPPTLNSNIVLNTKISSNNNAAILHMSSSRSSGDSPPNGDHNKKNHINGETNNSPNGSSNENKDNMDDKTENKRELSSPSFFQEDDVVVEEEESIIAKSKKEEEVEQRLLKQIRISETKAKIDQILSRPDAPFDVEHEMQRVVSIVPETMELVTDEEKDEKISNLETKLYQAVSKEKQDYFSATKYQKEISQQYVDDCAAVLCINSQFYKAFSQKNVHLMKQLWLHDNTSVCIHPSHKPIVGAKQICDSWEKMFTSKNNSFQRNWMEPNNIRIIQKGATTAIVTCDEHVFCRRFVRGKKRQTELINKLTATNIFRKVNNKWYLFYHHASWHADSRPAKLALNNNSGNNNNDNNNLASSGSRTNTFQQDLLQLGNDHKVNNHNDDDDDDDAMTGLDGILGMNNFGPLLGDDSNAPNNADPQQPGVKRVFMGNLSELSDILGGGLGDLLSDGGDKKGNTNDNGVNKPRTIIHFNNQIEEDDDDDDEDYMTGMESDDEDDDDDDDEDDDDDAEAVAVVQQLAKWTDPDHNNGRATKNTIESSSSKKTSDKKSSISSPPPPPPPKDTLRQNCIMALRNLCQKGIISPKQKRLLLTDIITCSAKGEFSMVEVAYELLCGTEAEQAAAAAASVAGDETDEDINKVLAEEEFADQCRVFAGNLENEKAALSSPFSPSQQHPRHSI